MRLIVDASVALFWNIASQSTPLTEEAAAEIQRSGGVVPFHFQLEMCNALWVLERRGKLSASDANETIDNIAMLDLEVDELAMHKIGETVLPLARLYRLTLYDAAYLELALRTDLPLATRDEALAAAAKKAGAKLFAP